MATVTVYTARCVRTMDPGRPVASAVAVMDGKVLSTGTLDSIKPWLDRHDHVIDDRFTPRPDISRCIMSDRSTPPGRMA